jgi:hypothetical protein
LKRIDVGNFLTSIEIENNNKILYPNPTTGEINISLTKQNASYFSYEVVSNTGQILLSDEIGYLSSGDNTFSINIPSISCGQYILYLFSSQEKFIFNIIKE